MYAGNELVLAQTKNPHNQAEIPPPRKAVTVVTTTGYLRTFEPIILTYEYCNEKPEWPNADGTICAQQKYALFQQKTHDLGTNCTYFTRYPPPSPVPEPLSTACVSTQGNNRSARECKRLNKKRHIGTYFVNSRLYHVIF